MASSPQMIAGIGTSPLTQTARPISCDGFYSPDDEMRHVITGTITGDIVETFFNPEAGMGQANLTNVASLRSVGCFYTNDDGIRHVIALDQDGRVSEIYYSPRYGVSAAALGTLANANKVRGFFTPDESLRHAIVGTASGDIFDIKFGRGIETDQLASVADLVDVAGFLTPDDGFRCVIAASLDGTITQIAYRPNDQTYIAPLATVPGVRRISGFWTGSDVYSRRILALYESADGQQICELRYQSGNDLVRNELGAAENAVDLGGFFSPDDGMSHCIVASESGDSRELFY